MRRARAAVLAVVAAAAGSVIATPGCIPSYPVAEGELDRYWTLTDVSAAAAALQTRPAATAAAGKSGFQFPTRWVIRQQPSLVWSTVSIVRAMDKLKAGTSEVEFAVSPAHARALVNLLAQARAALADLREMLETSGRGDKDRWARTLAAALAKMESLTRRMTAEEPPPGPPGGAGGPLTPAGVKGGKEEPLGMAGEPVMSLLAQYLNARSGGRLLEDLSPGELQRLRDVLAQTVVRLGFEVAGKEPSAAVRKEITELMRGTASNEDLQKALGKLLTEQIGRAAPARGGDEKRQTVLTVLRWAPKGIKLLESFLSQWDRIDRITVELLRRESGSAVAVTLATLPGRQIRIDDVMTGLPVLVFRGTTRILIQPDATPAGETVVAFDAVGDGAVELRYEGLIYALVRLLALPLDSGPLREVRVSSGGTAEGEQLVNVAVLSEAAGDRTDPRRMIVVQDSRVLRIVRRAFSVQAVTASSETVVSYITPTRRYTYERIKREGAH